MPRDIDQIISGVRQRLPAVRVVQMHKIHPADDDGLWWFRIPGISKDIQIESSSGNVPFIVETDDDKSTANARTATTVPEAVDMITEYLTGLLPPLEA